MKRKLCLFGISAALAVLMVGCEEARAFARGYNEGSSARESGYTWVCTSSSSSDCASACKSKGYSYYLYSAESTSCYCK